MTPAPVAAAPAPAAAAPADIPHAAIFGALPAPGPKDPSTSPELFQTRVDLGRMLYYDTRLSVNDTISCNSCHQLDRFGVDGEPTSPGFDGTRGGRNSPTVYNASVHFVQFWDGRAADLEEQAKGPVLNPVEMGMADAETVEAKIRAVEGYQPLFAAAFPGEEQPITYDHIADAIGAFERTLLTPAPFDAYLGGDLAALTEEQRAGLDTFVNTGCIACHVGAGVGGTMYQKMGLANAYEMEDVGRFEVTGNESERFFFKVPSLRNIEHTGPYFHDGSIATLEEAVSLMAHHQLNKDLSEEEVSSIVAFLKSLSAEPDAEHIAPPELPS